MRFLATKEQITQLIANAVNASKPMGMGHWTFKAKKYPAEDFNERVFLPNGDLVFRKNISIDYYDGRMVKLHLNLANETPNTEGQFEWSTSGPVSIDYQSWVDTYEDYKALAASVQGIQIMESING